MNIPEAIRELQSPVTDAARSAAALNAVLTYGPEENLNSMIPKEGAPQTRYGRLINELRSSHPRQADQLLSWVWTSRSRTRRFALYFIRLFNEGFGCTESLVDAFLREKQSDDSFSYLFVFLILLGANRRKDPRIAPLLTRSAREESLARAEWMDVIKDLANDRSLVEFVRGLQHPLRVYGGGTNTVLNLYDKHFESSFSGFNVEADFLGDLGGGFSTAEISRLAGRPFTSLDPNSPNFSDWSQELADYLVIHKLRDQTWHLATPDERKQHIEAQARVPWIRWNLLHGTPLIELLGDHDSYGFVSTGFMTSTVRPLKDDGTVSDSDYSFTTQTSCQRVMELVAMGKDVSLFTVERATARLRWLSSCLFRWQDRKLVALKLEPQDSYRIWKDTTKKLVADFITPGKPMLW